MVHLSIIIMHWTHKPKENVETSSTLSDSSETLDIKYINTPIRFPSRTLICPIVGILMCLLLMWFTTKWAKIQLICWNLVIGQAVYWLYSRKHSILGNKRRTNPETIDSTNACGNNLAQGQQQQNQHPREVTTISKFTQTTIDDRAILSVKSTKMLKPTKIS